MPITEGYSLYECEVATCNKKVYAQSGNAAAAGYVEVMHIDATGVTRSMVLCGGHSEKYQKMAEWFDAKYDEFSRSGDAAIIDPSDYILAVSQLTDAQEALAEMTKKRDQWHDKYRALEAEYNALLNGGE